MQQIVDNKIKLKNFFNHLYEKYFKSNTKPINITVVEASKPKTKKQLGYVFGMLIDDIYNDFKTNGYFLDILETRAKNLIREILYNECSIINEIICPKTEKEYSIKIRMSEMDIHEMSNFITKVIDWCDSLQILLRPETRYVWLNSLTEQEIEEALSIHYPEKDEGYLRSVRKQTCILSGEYGCDVHHIKDLSEAGLGSKTPDWYVLPIAHKYHVRQDGHITTNEILESTKAVLQGYDLKTFCKLCYWKWKYCR